VCREAYQFLPVQVWSGQRLATSPAPNPTHREVTNYVKLGGGRYRAATKVHPVRCLQSNRVNVLSPEITSVLEAKALHLAAGSILLTESGEVKRTRRGLRQWQGAKWN